MRYLSQISSQVKVREVREVDEVDDVNEAPQITWRPVRGRGGEGVEVGASQPAYYPPSPPLSPAKLSPEIFRIPDAEFAIGL